MKLSSFYLKTKYKPHYTFKNPIFSFVQNILVLNKHFFLNGHVNNQSQNREINSLEKIMFHKCFYSWKQYDVNLFSVKLKHLNAFKGGSLQAKRKLILVWIYTTQRVISFLIYHDRSIRAKYIHQIMLKNNPLDNEGM